MNAQSGDINMNDSNLILPIFPLPVFMLPGGISRLRIFEPRYLKMIKIATKAQGFVIWSNHQVSNSSSFEWGSWVDIINFDQGDDGILEIDVKCKSLVEIPVIKKNADNLHFGEIKKISHWSQNLSEPDPVMDELTIGIEEVFENNATLKMLYVEKPTDNISWVIARWLELLPVDLSIKSSFVAQYGFIEAKGFVESIILK